MLRSSFISRPFGLHFATLHSLLHSALPTQTLYILSKLHIPGNEQAELVYLITENLSAGFFEAEDYEPDSSASSILITEVEAAIEFFREDYNRDDEDLKELRNKLYNAPAYVLGAPIWLQFDEKFADINLGDSGIMYVFGDTAFWQCY